jgi:hypothetical protein
MRCQKFKTLRSGFLYRLSLDPKARALAERLLERFRCLVGNLPASADHPQWSVLPVCFSVSKELGDYRHFVESLLP